LLKELIEISLKLNAKVEYAKINSRAKYPHKIKEVIYRQDFIPSLKESTIKSEMVDLMDGNNAKLSGSLKKENAFLRIAKELSNNFTVHV
jgi:hypothetical protein